MYLGRPNRRTWYPGTELVLEETITYPKCPTSLTFDSTTFTFDNGSCSIFDLGERLPFTFDSTLFNMSGTHATMDEAR